MHYGCIARKAIYANYSYKHRINRASSCFMFYKRYTSIQTREKCTHNGVSVQNTRGTLVPPVLVLLGHQKFQYFPKLLERLISAVQPQLLKYYGPRHQETL